MPTLTVNGHSVTVDDSFLKLSPDEQNATVDEIAKSLPEEKPSGVIAGAQEGLSNLIHGPAETAKQFFGVDTAGADKVAQNVAPKNYKSAQVVPEDGHWYDPRTYNYSQIPQAIAEAAPGMAADITAAKVASRIPVIGKVAAPLAGVASYLMRTRGDTAKNDAVIRTGDANAEPETQDKARSLATGVAESIPQAIGIGRFLPGANAVKAVGQAGVSQALKKALATGSVEAGAGATSNVISQAGATIGTPGGLKVDPSQVVDAGITSGATGGLMAAPRTIADVQGARKYAKFGGDNQDATTALMNRTSKALDGADVTPKSSFEALRTADEGVRDELKQAIKPVKSTLDEDTLDALKRAGKGRTLTDSDLSNIEENTTPDVAFLARQAHVASLVKDMGDYGGGQFIGGTANAVGKHIRAVQNPAGAAASAALGAAGLGGHAASLFAYGPSTLAAIAGGYAGMRGIDALTGNRVPLKGIMDRFANPDAQVRMPAPVAPEEPVAPPPTSGPTGPQVPFNPGVAGGGTALALGQNPFAPKPAPPEAAPTIDPLALPKDMLSRSKVLTDALRNVQKMREAAQAQQAQSAPAPTPAIDPLALPKDILARAKVITGGIQNTQEMRDRAISNRAVDRIANASPLVDEVGGLGAIDRPQVGKRASQLVSAARALQTLMRQPEEEGQGGPAPTPQVPSPPVAPAAPQPEAPVSPTPAPEGPSPVDAMKISQRALAKITKKAGGQAKAEAPEAAEPPPYEPLPESELWRKALPDAQVANRELSKYEPDVRRRYAKNVIANRVAKRDIMSELADSATNDADGTLMGKLYHELDHTSRRARAIQAVEHFTSKMSPEAASAVKARLGPLMEKLWTHA